METYGRKAEYAAARARDPILQFRAKLTGNATLSDEAAKKIEEGVRAEMEEVVQFALKSPFPAPEDALKYVYA
ncbi:MAG: hypothetical protein LAN71_07005 [Acidobacteriia bacterium]|nr:hypothetical protein [Terriglobia bacterium]